MRWALITFTHYTGNDAMFENFSAEDYAVIEADSLADALAQVSMPGESLAQIDDSDSPYGGVFTSRRVARRYFKLNDFALSNTLCYGLFAENVLMEDFDRMAVA